jgi:hypothetical protein
MSACERASSRSARPSASQVFRLDFNDIHFDEYTFPPSTNQSGLRVSRVVESLLNIPVDVTCDHPVEAIRCPMALDASWQAAAKGLFSMTPFDAKLTFDVVGEEDVAIGGELVPTWHVHETRTLSGAIAGEMSVDYWYAKSNGILIRGKILGGNLTSTTVDGLTMVTAFGPFEYKVRIEFKIKSLAPTPLDAGADG